MSGKVDLPRGAKIAYTIDEAAASLGVCKSTVYTLIRGGDLELRKFIGRSVIPAASLEACFERRSQVVKPAA